MLKSDRTLKAILLAIAIFLGMIAFRPFYAPGVTAFAQSARYDHVYLASTTYLYKGRQGLLVLDKRNANVWFIPKLEDRFGDPVFIIRIPFDKLDQAPQ